MKKLILFKILPLLIIQLVLNSQAQGASPWKWESGLQTKRQQGGVMHLPVGLYVDKEEQRYYVVDGGNNRIVSFERDGEFRSSFTASKSLSKPYDLIRNPGFLWIVEKGKNSLTEIDLKNKKIIPKTLTFQGRVIYPDRIARDKDTFLVLDKASGMIFLLDENMDVRANIGCDECQAGFVDFKLKDGAIWALTQYDQEVRQFSMTGKLVRSFKLDKEKTRFPRSLAVDDADNIYILDRHAGNVSVYDRSGSYRYQFLEPGHSRGQLYYPAELLFDPWGRICIVDEGNGRVQIFSKK